MAQDQEQVAATLKQNSGEVKKGWGRLSDAERLKIKEKRTILVSKIQKRYGHRERENLPTTE